MTYHVMKRLSNLIHHLLPVKMQLLAMNIVSSLPDGELDAAQSSKEVETCMKVSQDYGETIDSL